MTTVKSMKSVSETIPGNPKQLFSQRTRSLTGLKTSSVQDETAGSIPAGYANFPFFSSPVTQLARVAER